VLHGLLPVQYAPRSPPSALLRSCCACMVRGCIMSGTTPSSGASSAPPRCTAPTRTPPGQWARSFPRVPHQHHSHARTRIVSVRRRGRWLALRQWGATLRSATRSLGPPRLRGGGAQGAQYRRSARGLATHRCPFVARACAAVVCVGAPLERQVGSANFAKVRAMLGPSFAEAASQPAKPAVAS
jgi:hypothetical protein